jgi:hypothetical protein
LKGHVGGGEKGDSTIRFLHEAKRH